MYRGTTPTLTISLTDGSGNPISADGFAKLWLTFKCGGVLITKEKGDLTISDNQISVTLTQDDTLSFSDEKGAVQIQLRTLSDDGKATASEILSVPVERILKDGVIS